MPYFSLLTGTIDVGVADSILDMLKSLLTLFTVYPLNIFLGASLLGLGVGLFTQLRHSV